MPSGGPIDWSDKSGWERLPVPLRFRKKKSPWNSSMINEMK